MSLQHFEILTFDVARTTESTLTQPGFHFHPSKALADAAEAKC